MRVGTRDKRKAIAKASVISGRRNEDKKNDIAIIKVILIKKASGNGFSTKPIITVIINEIPAPHPSKKPTKKPKRIKVSSIIFFLLIFLTDL